VLKERDNLWQRPCRHAQMLVIIEILGVGGLRLAFLRVMARVVMLHAPRTRPRVCQIDLAEQVLFGGEIPNAG
jgi:hypothetical protein